MRAAVAAGTLVITACTLMYVAYFASEEATTAVRLGPTTVPLGKARAGLVLQTASGGRGWNALRASDGAHAHRAAHDALANRTARQAGGALTPARSKPSVLSREGCEALPVGDMVDVNGTAALAPSLAISRTRLLLSPRETPPLKCALFVYFHFAKAGGTSMREAMARQAINGTPTTEVTKNGGKVPAPAQPRSWGRPVGKDVGWEFALRTSQRLREWLGSADERKKSPRLFVECHASCVFVPTLAVVQAARPRLEREGCTVLTLTHLREPVSQVLSAWYYWAIKWDASKVASPAGWVRSWIKPDHYYNEYLYGRPRGFARLYADARPSRRPPNASTLSERAAAPPGTRAEGAGGGSEGAAAAAAEEERCRPWLEQTDAFLNAVDIVGTVANWERTWLRVAALLRFPKLEPRQHKGLASCLSKRERSTSPRLSDRCQKARLCRDFAIQPTDVAALTAKMGCSRQIFARWEPRSEESLRAYELALAAQPSVTLAEPTFRPIARSAFARRGGSAPPAAAGRVPAREDGPPPRVITLKALDLFRERACHLRANYFCNWAPGEERLAPLRELMRREDIRKRARSAASAAWAKRAADAAARGANASAQQGGGRVAAGDAAAQPRNQTMEAGAVEAWHTAQAYERQSAQRAQQHWKHRRGRQGKGGGSGRPRGARSVSAQSWRERRAVAARAAAGRAGDGGAPDKEGASN